MSMIGGGNSGLSPRDSSACGRGFEGFGGVAAEFLGASHGGADAFDLKLPGGDLPGGLAVFAGLLECAGVAGQHPAEDGSALFLGWAWPQPRQTSPRGQCSPVGRAQTWVPMSRMEQLAVNSAHSALVGAWFASAP